jgi:eukaryotic-like serine/threonine-protein kinase
MRNEEQEIAQLEGMLGDKYQVLRRIGGGGMAQVFLARHRRLGRVFAVKVLAESLAQDPQIVARFEQEARTSASLSGHPNIVPIFDVGQGGDLHYLIMQYISGEDMASYLRRQQKLTPADAANVVAQTAEALTWSESRRVVHRDLKPANMLLDIMGRVMILDFGISKIADIAGGLTRPGESLGTPYYMSPEQIRGEGCDVRSDLYSLGVVFFELLTGRKPFAGQSNIAIQMAHLSQPVPSLLSLDQELPPICDELVQKLMQKRREDRFQSPQELLGQLRLLGATSEPGLLRPQLNAALQMDLSRPVTVTPSGRTSDPQSSAVPGSRGAMATPSGTPSGSGARQVQPVPHQDALGSRSGRKRSRAWIIGGAMAAVVAAVLLALVLTPIRPASVIEDPHGKMVYVPAGDFIFGDDSPEAPRPRQSRSTRAFYIDETEVSNREYKQFVDATGHPPPDSTAYLAHPELPVTNVTFDDAQSFAEWVGKRLPSEEEWEKAARGTKGQIYPWGDDPWTSGVPTELQPIDSFPDRKSPFGALNMAGNVLEWTTARHIPNERELADMHTVLGNTAFSRTWYSAKGGSFSPHGDILFFRCYMRRVFPADQPSPVIGFRCVRNVRKASLKTRMQSLFSKP